MSLDLPVDDSFYRKILDLEDRLTSLQQAAPTERGQLVDLALEELKTSLEELHVSHEELQSQNAELEAARYALEEERQRYLDLFEMAPDGYVVTDTNGTIREANQAVGNLLGLSPQFLVGKPLVVLIGPEDRQEFSFELSRVRQHQRPAEFETRLQPREAEAFAARLTVNPVRDPQGKLTGLRWLVHDTTARNRLEALHIRQRLSELSHISQVITNTLELPVVLQNIVNGACQLVGARYGALSLSNASGEIEQFVTYGVTPEERRRIGDLPRGRGLLGWLQQQHEPIRLADLTQHPQAVGFPRQHPAMKTFLGVPVRFDHQVLANLYLTEKQGGQEFTQDDENLLVLFATEAALVINNAMTYQQERAARREAEEARSALAESEHRFHLALDNSAVTIWTQDRELRYTWLYNPVGNFSAEAVVGKTDADFFQGDELARLIEIKQRVLETGLVERSVMAGTLAGEERFYDLTVEPLRDESGAIQGIACAASDITDLKRTQLAAEVEHRRLHAVVENSPVGIVLIEAGGAVRFRNLEAQRIFGVVHQPEYDFQWYASNMEVSRFDGSPIPPEVRPINRALRFGEVTRAMEILYRAPSGHEAHALVNAIPILSPEGEVAAVLVTLQDMAPLEEYDRLRTEFLGMVSHELRTPITAIKGAAATVLGSRRGVDPQEALEFFQIINEQVDHLTGLVNNLLDLTRIESGTLSVNPGPVDLREVLQEAMASFARAGNSQEVQLQLPSVSGGLVVQADPRRIGQVIINLLTNAAKFSPLTSPIFLRAEPGPTHVVVQVQDSGRGIPPEALSQLFRKFSQVYESSDRNHGTGLGLAICKGIVEAHGGRIWAESPGLGQGATFSFTLPLAVESPAATGPSEDRVPGPGSSVSGPIQRARVLAVDDDPHVLRYLRRLLDDAEYDVVATDSPDSAMSLVQTERPDLVILDLVLPGTNGLELLRQIRQFSAVPVIFLTSQDDDQTVVSVLRAGADDYITKPFSASELLARMDTVLRRRSDTGEDRTMPPFVLHDPSGDPQQTLTIDFFQRRVTVGDEVVILTSTEYRLLYQLASNAGRTLTHNQLLQSVWGDEYSGETYIVRSMVRNLRSKLGDDARNPRFILTETGVGYRMPRP